MLNENKNIDQIFREKLGEYEKTPPMFVWTNIQGELNARKKIVRYALLKTVGIAAAIVLAFLAGWHLTNPDHKGTSKQNIYTEQKGINQNIDSSSGKNTTTINLHPVDSNQAASNTSEIFANANQSNSSSLSSLATFGANTSFIDRDHRLAAHNLHELELYETEKDFLDKLHQNFKVVKKLTDWLASVKSDPVVDSSKNSTIMKSIPSIHKTVQSPDLLSLNNSVRKNNGRWILKAEFAPVFTSQIQYGSQKTDLLYLSSQSTPQETVAENSFSGGMIVGFKVGKRVVVKSGIVYNNIRQMTRNVNLLGVNPEYNVPGNATLASTPTGQVSLSKMTVTRVATVLNSNSQFDNSATYSVKNELRQNIEFIEIPVQATYKLIDKKFIVGLTGAISTNFLVGNKAILSGNGVKITDGETTNMRNIVYSGAIGFEMGYEINNRITLTVEPRIKHYISSLSSSKSNNYKPGQLEIVTGLSYCFN